MRVIREGRSREDCELLRLVTARGDVRCRYYPAPTHKAVIFLGGIAGKWGSPARGLYSRLSLELADRGIGALRIRFRHPGELGECEFDALAGIEYLQRHGAHCVALIGHSFGAATAIRAAALSNVVRAVVALCPQSYGAGAVKTLGPQCALLLIHGQEDAVLPAQCSIQLFRVAAEPKRLLLIPGAGHCLEEAAADVEYLVREWLSERLAAMAGPAPPVGGP
ncbi:MAG: dienelactone hydrolase family protein [Elusimicrobia bacterium]|nr:dienelactone hydrolase family protein [Elusimicrobiota bacterium]